MQSHMYYAHTYSSYVYISHCHCFYNNRNVTYVIAYVVIVCAFHRQIHFNHATVDVHKRIYLYMLSYNLLEQNFGGGKQLVKFCQNFTLTK